MKATMTIIVALAALQPTPSHATCTTGRQHKYQHQENPLPFDQFGTFVQGGYCCASGLQGSPCSPSTNPVCPSWYWIGDEVFDCNDNSLGVVGLAWPNAICACETNPADGHAIFQLNAHPDSKVYSTTCIVETNCPDPEPQYCDGKDDGAAAGASIDLGCGDDEHKCTSAHGEDPFPVNLSSGRVEIQPITVFALPTPPGIEFAVALKFASHRTNQRATKQTIGSVTDTVPTIHQSDDETHFYGNGWSDTFSDRLNISVDRLPASEITWVSMNGIVTFHASQSWKSTGGKFQLFDRGSDPDGLGRWVIQSTDTQAPRQTWSFEEVTFTNLNGFPEKIGRLRRRALSAAANDPLGFYGFTLSWTTDGLLDSVVDTLGRQITIVNTMLPAGCSGAGCMYNQVSGIRYKPAPTASSYDVATFGYSSGRLERITRSGVAGYHRFLYWLPPANCKKCGQLISDVIVPVTDGVAPPPQSALTATEVAVEHHEFTVSTAANPPRPLALASSGIGRSYRYLFDEAAVQATQFDVHQPTGTCQAGCAVGSACDQTSGNCYVAQTIAWSGLRVPVKRTPAQLLSNIGSGDRTAVDITYASPQGTPIRSIDNGGVKTTTGYDTKGRLRCLVRGDNDDQAFQTPSSPDTSACAGPAGAQIVRVDFAANSITKTVPGPLGLGDLIEVQTLGANLMPASIAITGRTKDVSGAVSVVTKTVTRNYDAIGRLIEANGSLSDASALDKTTYAFYTAFDPANPFNFGQLQSETVYVGTSASSLPITTTYSNYDLFGVPHKVIAPNLESIEYVDSASRLAWDIRHLNSAGGLIGTAHVNLNANGTVRSMADADGVCMTYEYSDASGYVGAPTKIRRSNTACGVVPINVNSDEVEIRTYASGERDRLASIERRTNGGVELSLSGFTYDRERRLVAASTLNSASPFTFGFTDVLPSSTVAPTAPASGAWRTDTTADSFGRPASLLRFIDATNKQTFTYSYATTFTPHPTQMTRGFNNSATSVTSFVYDDFGRLIETVVPEAGLPGAPSPTRYEYDVADRRTKMRVGVGSALVRTSVYSYDSLGRTTAVDHDTEHPVNCAGAANGTPIQDEEYRYDDCAGDVPAGFSCSNAKGRLTINRAILQCSSGQVIKRGRWYDYDGTGRLFRVAYATVTGATIGAPAVAKLSYTAASRVAEWTNPIVASYGTKYTFDAKNGRPVTLGTTATSSTTIASALAYRTFGELKAMTTPVIQPVAGGQRQLIFQAGFRSDDSRSTYRWLLSSLSVGTIGLVDQTYAYWPAGVVKQRTDAADIQSSRYYGMDSLVRMTCEARGSGTTQPSSGDCTTSSSRLAGLFTYGDGQSASSPQDVRLTAFIKNASYTSPSTETYGYASGSSQITQVTRTGSNLVLGHDVLGRRQFDYPSNDTTAGRRDYTYLPNGQLGTVTRGGTSVTTVRYDNEGHPLTIVAGATTYELFWSDGDMLIAVVVDGGTTTWHYHYLGNLLVALTRVIGTNVKRFWVVSDERQLIHRLVDDQGATFWQARWDATGWRELVGTPQPNIYLPFALPGQLIIEGSAAGLSTLKRAEIALNQRRAYDPTTGSFLQPDGADLEGRLEPEGYAYSRSYFTTLFDRSGTETPRIDLPNALRFDFNCTLEQQATVSSAISNAVAHLSTCVGDSCIDTETIRQLIHRLFQVRIHCAEATPNTWRRTPWGARYKIDRRGAVVVDGEGSARAVTEVFSGHVLLPPIAFFWNFYESHYCLERTIAHEALHVVVNNQREAASNSAYDLQRIYQHINPGVDSIVYEDQPDDRFWSLSLGIRDGDRSDGEERSMNYLVRRCIPCKSIW